MIPLVQIAINAVFDSITEKLNTAFVNGVMFIMSQINSLSALFYQSELVKSALSFSRWLGYFVLAGA